MPKDKIKDLEGLEGVYDVLMSEDFFEEMDADTLLLDSLERRYEAGAPLGEGGVVVSKEECAGNPQGRLAQHGRSMVTRDLSRRGAGANHQLGSPRHSCQPFRLFASTGSVPNNVQNATAGAQKGRRALGYQSRQ